MSRTIDRIIETTAQFKQVIGSLENNMLALFRRDLERFAEETKNMSNQMQWQSRSAMALTLFAGTFALGGTLLKMGPGIVANLPVYFQDPNRLRFVRALCKTTHGLLSGAIEPSNLVFRSQTTETEAKRTEIQQVQIQGTQSLQTHLGQQAQSISQTVQQLMSEKSRSGG